MFQKYIVPTIGVAAFVVGGLVAQAKAVEIVDIVKKSLSETPSS